MHHAIRAAFAAAGKAARGAGRQPGRATSPREPAPDKTTTVPASDADPARQAVQALEQHAFAPDDQTKVILSKDWLTLESEVSTWEQKWAAAAPAGLAGIHGIRKDIAFANGALAHWIGAHRRQPGHRA